MQSPFSFVNFLHSGAGGQQVFGGLNPQLNVGGGQLGQSAGKQPATRNNVDILRALLLAGAAPQRLRGESMSQSDPLASLPGVNMLARMNPGFNGGGGGGGPGGPGGAGAGGGGGQR